ncbi:cupin domain-containing protein [Aliihoeflea aestuarii]|jgi:putative transcriptional regulator|uniref:ChrR family anti-sigma-E factor n=1 Tax=Aliihoeflea aestuarii TaxID=453840 RepID=UPI002092C159|nr:ChrR family anti-sigma-E factor [Aliihoeflea aestuarii]MCO6390584.1 cupin domain-containing protein [Aliihoeflea aestuarii]
MTAETIDTIDVLMARYVAGSLPYPAHVLVRAHLEIARANHSFVAGLEDMAGDALEDGVALPLTRRLDRLAKIFETAPSDDHAAPAETPGVFPTALRDFVGFDETDIPWRTKMPGFREYEFESDGCHASIYWIKPGRKIPAHTHEGQELTLVLDGAFADGDGRYGRGDIAIADDTVDHRPIAESERPCICFAVTDAPLRLTGSLGQRLGDILGL